MIVVELLTESALFLEQTAALRLMPVHERIMASDVSPQKSVAESPCCSRLPRGGKTGILARSTRNVSPLERAALCSKTLTCTASQMNRHANSSGGCSTCWKT